MKHLTCQGNCQEAGGCDGPVSTVVVSRLGEMDLCDYAVKGYEYMGFVVSYVHDRPFSDPDNDRPDVDLEVLRQLGHFMENT